MSDEPRTLSELSRRYLLGEITYEEMRTIEDRYVRRRNPPIWQALFWVSCALNVAALVVIVLLVNR